MQTFSSVEITHLTRCSRQMRAHTCLCMVIYLNTCIVIVQVHTYEEIKFAILSHFRFGAVIQLKKSPTLPTRTNFLSIRSFSDSGAVGVRSIAIPKLYKYIHTYSVLLIITPRLDFPNLCFFPTPHKTQPIQPSPTL